MSRYIILRYLYIVTYRGVILANLENPIDQQKNFYVGYIHRGNHITRQSFSYSIYNLFCKQLFRKDPSCCLLSFSMLCLYFGKFLC